MTGAPLLSVVMIVRDEAQNLPGCLASVRALGDLLADVVVHDTGSVDGTPELAEQLGAVVVRGTWHHDFARARNEVLACAATPWALSLDADEHVAADPVALRAALEDAGDADVLGVHITNTDRVGDLTDVHIGGRLLARGTVMWQGRVHEQPVRRDGTAPRVVVVPDGALRLDHTGYVDPAVTRGKSLRNLLLAEAALVEARRSGVEGTDLAALLVHVGRARAVLGQASAAADVFAEAVGQAPLSPAGWSAAVGLAELLIASDHAEQAVRLMPALPGPEHAPGLRAWIVARALARCGRDAEALAVLRTVDEVVDLGRVRIDPGAVRELHALVAARVGDYPAALEALLRAMATGRIVGRGRLLMSLGGQVGEARLVEQVEVLVTDPAVRARLAAEVSEVSAAGATLAHRLQARTPV